MLNADDSRVAAAAESSAQSGRSGQSKKRLATSTLRAAAHRASSAQPQTGPGEGAVLGCKVVGKPCARGAKG